ncbi:ABC transporter permease [Clostridiaceae bacterium M8S5]|nr:ABC transporter permease [Clostridiaceae bacterium M8S5]
MSGFVEMIKVEFKCFVRNIISMFFVILFPVLLLLVFGEMYGNKPNALFNGRGSVDILVPSYIGMIVAITGIMSLPLMVSSYREKKILKRFKATPMSPFHLLVSQIIVNIVMTIIGIILLIIVAKLKYNLHFDGNILSVLCAFFITVICIFSIGFLIASVVNNTKTASAVSNIVYFPMLFLTGATIPLETMPNTMKSISKFLPLTHAIKLLKGAWFGESLSNYQSEILILLGFTVVLSVASVKLFKWE